MEIDELSASATLACAQTTMLDRRRTEVRDLELAAHWCDLHAALPRDPSGHTTLTTKGRPMLVEIGGDGTPLVNDLSLCELGIARSVGPLAARNIAADALDLRHRLPRTWAKVKALECEPWVARKVASMSRSLSMLAIEIVDSAVADAIVGQAPYRVLELCQAKIVEADPAAHQARLDEQARRRYAALGRVDEHGLQLLIARVTAGDARAVDEMLERVADVLAADPATHDLPVDAGRDLLRSAAIGWLARPVDLFALLLRHPQPEPPDGHAPDEQAERGGDQSEPTDEQPVAPGHTAPDRTPITSRDLLEALHNLDLDRLRSTAVVYLHLTTDALGAGVDGNGVARVEGLGPHTMGQLRALLRHDNVVVKPVIDLRDRVSTAAYEFPDHIRERIHLLHLGDAFPHATHTSHRTDIDHPTPWTRDGHRARPTVTPGNPSPGHRTAPRPTWATGAPPCPPARTSGARPTDCTASSTPTAPTPSTRPSTTPGPAPARPNEGSPASSITTAHARPDALAADHRRRPSDRSIGRPGSCQAGITPVLQGADRPVDPQPPRGRPVRWQKDTLLAPRLSCRRRLPAASPRYDERGRTARIRR